MVKSSLISKQYYQMETEIVLVTGDEYEEKFVWSQPMVKLLIEEFKKVQHEFTHSHVKKKHVWRKIAQAFADEGYQVSEDMCDKKWRNLKKTFKEIYIGNRNNTTRTKWAYYNDVVDIFGQDPNIINASPAMSNKSFIPSKRLKGPDGRGMRVELMEVVGNLDEEYLEEGEPTGEGDESQMWTSYENPSQQEPPTWFSEFLQQYRIDEEKRVEMLSKMHAEVMAVEEKKCMLLASLVEKLGAAQEVDQTTTNCNYYLQLSKEDAPGE